MDLQSEESLGYDPWPAEDHGVVQASPDSEQSKVELQVASLPAAYWLYIRAEGSVETASEMLYNAGQRVKALTRQLARRSEFVGIRVAVADEWRALAEDRRREVEVLREEVRRMRQWDD